MAVLPKKLVTTVLGEADTAMRQAKLAARRQRMQQADEIAYNEFLEQVELDKPDFTAESVEVAAKEAESARVAGITDPKGGSIFHQTQNVDEFRARMADQLTPTVPKESQKVHTQTVDQVLGRLRENPRWTARTKEWVGDSPYAGDVMFHVDRITDPTRPNSFIQFETPREMGLHAGTNSAAESVVKGGGITEAIRNQQLQQQAFEQISGELDIPLKELEQTFAQVSNDHFRSVFQGGKEPAVWDEVQSIVDQFVQRINAPSLERQKFIQELKDAPRPSTTPFLFKGRNGLLLEDNGNFKPTEVARQLQEVFNNAEDFDAIQTAASGVGETEKTQGLQAFIESKGFDHIVYRNTVEDKGSLSIINWNPDLQRVPWDPEFTRGNPSEGAKAATAFVMAMLGIGNAELRE